MSEKSGLAMGCISGIRFPVVVEFLSSPTRSDQTDSEVQSGGLSSGIKRPEHETEWLDHWAVVNCKEKHLNVPIGIRTPAAQPVASNFTEWDITGIIRVNTVIT
jgi:hypothetical protein